MNDKWIESKIDMLIYRLYIDRIRDRETGGKRERERHGDTLTESQIDIKTYRQTTRKKFKTERKTECCRKINDTIRKFKSFHDYNRNDDEKS